VVDFGSVHTTNTCGCHRQCNTVSKRLHMSTIVFLFRHTVEHRLQRRPDVDEEQLSHQLDSLLLANHFVEHLTSLSITNTPLTRVPASVCKLLNLISLNLDHNKITELPDNCFTKLTKLVTLRAEDNAITRLHDGLFEGLQSLMNLHLRDNQISFIGLRVFSNTSVLTNVRLVDLDNNRLTSLEPWWYYRCILGNETSPVKISLRRNLISNITNKLQFEFRCGMKPPHGSLDLYDNQMAHIMDIFSGWNMAGHSLFTTIICLRNRNGPHPQMYFNFGGSTYVCDCTDIQFYTVLHNATLHVYCSATNLSSLPLDLPPLPKSYVKYKLDFSDNKLL